MSACVIDTSAVLAFLFQERGQQVASEWMDRGATISTANMLEVVAVLVTRAVNDGTDVQNAYVMALRNVESLVLDVADLTAEDALQAGAWVTFQKSANLSAGDRCCLALGKRLSLPVVHAEQVWQPLSSDLGVELVLVREMQDQQ